MNSRNRGNTDIVFPTVNHNGHTTILRLSFFGNIHAAHDFDTGGNCRKETVVVDHFFIESTIDTVAHTNLCLQCFYMNITGSLAYRLLNQRTYKLYDRRIADICFCCCFFSISTKLFTFTCESSRCIHGLGCTIAAIDCCKYITRCRNIWFNLQVCDDGNIVNCRHVHRIGHRKMQDIRIIRVKLKWNALVFLKEIHTDQATDFLRNRHAGKFDHL